MKTIYYNGNIITMDNKKIAKSILVEDGIIKQVSVKNIIPNDSNIALIDLDGKTMLPAFIDSHSHFTALAISLSQCDLSNARCFDDIVNALKDFIDKNQIKDKQWVVGVNYDHNNLAEGKHPDKKLLDTVSFDNPILIVHSSSHFGVTNSMGLEMQNITNSINDVEGGKFGRYPNSDELTGYLEENALINFRSNMPMPEISQIFQLMKKAQKIYAKYGYLTIQEGMTNKELLRLLVLAADNKLLSLDVVSYLDIDTCYDEYFNNKEYINHYNNHLKIGGFKTFLDGSPQGKTAWMLKPYANEYYCGYPIKTDAQLESIIKKAINADAQLLAHCNGDAAANQYIKCFENALKNKSYSKAPVMIHAQFVTKDQLNRMKNINMIPSFFIAHTFYWGDIHIKNFGKERAGNISPAADALKLNLKFTLHQDTPVIMPNPFETIWCAATRTTKNGVKLNQDECISVYDALKALTINAAYQYNEQDTKGSIAPGKIADLIILSDNPLDCKNIKDIKVLEAIKAGNTINLSC